MDDPVYHAQYVAYVEETINGAFEPAKMAAIYQTYHDLIAPYVVGENGEQPGYTLLKLDLRIRHSARHADRPCQPALRRRAGIPQRAGIGTLSMVL